MYRSIFLTVVPLFFFSFLFCIQRRQELSAGPGEEPFDVTQHSVPLNQIRHGGPPKDGIPALMDPDFVSARQADLFLLAADRVLGVVRQGVAKAYPVKILNWHEVVNGHVGGDALVVSY